VPRLRKRLALAFLSPALQSAIADGRHPPGLTLNRLLSRGIPDDWAEQDRRFGFV
jgi:site-specific DNA recombinase